MFSAEEYERYEELLNQLQAKALEAATLDDGTIDRILQRKTFQALVETAIAAGSLPEAWLRRELLMSAVGRRIAADRAKRRFRFTRDGKPNFDKATILTIDDNTDVMIEHATAAHWVAHLALLRENYESVKAAYERARAYVQDELPGLFAKHGDMRTILRVEYGWTQ